MGDFLRQRREKLGLSIDDLAFLSHVRPRLIGGYERGEYSPGEKNLTALLVALKVRVPWLVTSGNRNNPGWLNDETSADVVAPVGGQPLAAAVR